MSKKYITSLIVLAVSIFFATCVYMHNVGRERTLYGALVTVGLLVTIRKGIKHSRHGRIMVLSGLGVLVSHAIYAQMHLTPLNVIIAPVVIIYGIRTLHFGSGHIEGLIKNYIRDRGRMIFSWIPAGRYLRSLFSRRESTGSFPKVKNNTISGIILAIIVLALLIPILSSTDDVFKNMFAGLSDQLSRFFTRLGDAINNVISIDRLIVLIIVFMVLLSLALFFRAAHPTKEHKGISRTMENAVYSIMARAIAVVYVLFAIIQIKYLFLGAQLPEGVTYAEYAVKGFWQLIGISLVNILLMLVAPRYHKSTSKNIYVILLRIIFLSSIVIRRSGLFRLRLYITTYGLTFMRILPLSFIIYLGYGLIIAFVGLWKHSLIRSNMLAYGLVIRYAAFQLIGVDTIIANYNIKRYVTGKTTIMDIDYLVKDLSHDQMRATYNIDTLQQFLTTKPDTALMIQQIESYKKHTQ